MTDDLELKQLSQYTGTMMYHNISSFDSQVTDGVAYIMRNGYSWFVTDAIAILRLHPKVMGKDFVSVKLKLKANGALVTYEDGNGSVLYKNKIDFTTAQRELTLYYTNGVLILSGEY